MRDYIVDSIILKHNTFLLTVATRLFHTGASNSEVESIIKSWLRTAPDRGGGRSDRYKRTKATKATAAANTAVDAEGGSGDNVPNNMATGADIEIGAASESAATESRN